MIVVCVIILSTLLLTYNTVTADGALVFSDNFSTNDFSNWTGTFTDIGASLNVATSVAHFYSPSSGTSAYAYKTGFTVPTAGVLTITFDIKFNNLPTGGWGDNELFVASVRDANWNKTTMHDNIAIFVDGLHAWHIQSGGLSPWYFDCSAGATTVSNTWYHMVLTYDIQSQVANLYQNGTDVLPFDFSNYYNHNGAYGLQLFSDSVHSAQAMTGVILTQAMAGNIARDIYITNFSLDITAPAPTPTIGDPETYVANTTIEAFGIAATFVVIAMVVWALFVSYKR